MMKETQAVWSIRPRAWERAGNNEWTRRLAATLHKWTAFAETLYRDWPDRPRCGHFFGGAYWYGVETAHTAAVYAALAAFPEPGAAAGFSTDHLAERAIRAIRYLGFTHDTGPEECVRAQGANPWCSGTKWGGRHDRYFMATQVGGSISYFGLAAWLLWDRLDDETRLLAQEVVSSYADRWSEEEPRNGTYFDTQLEENAWTGIGIFTAALMFPEHPHSGRWWDAYRKWNRNTTTTFRDRLNDKIPLGVTHGAGITTITLHPDYTTENHAFVHPTYMAASMHFRGRAIANLLLAGLPLDTTDTRNDAEMYERTLKFWAEADGVPSSVQGQDWWYNQQHGFLHVHALMNVVHCDGEAATLEEMALSAIEALQNSNDRGCYLEQHGEFCPILPQDYQTAIDMEHGTATHVLNAFLIHKLGGGGARPAEAERLAARLGGVREYPFGGFVVHRTPRTTAVFSWRNHVMALGQPRHGAWLLTPLYDSYTGTVRLSADGGSAPRHETFVTEAKKHRLDAREDGFAAYAQLERGDERLVQHVGFVSLPDGRTVYGEQFEAKADVTIAACETGAIGIRNEHYAALPAWAKGYRMLHTPEGARRFESWRPHSNDTIVDYPACAYVNVDNEAGYLLYGSNGVRYHNRHQFAKWKGGEDRLVLNYRAEPVPLAAGERTAPFVVVGMPYATAAETAEAAARGRMYGGAGAGGGAAVWTDGCYFVFFNCAEKSERFVFAEALESPESEMAAIPLFEGVTRIGGGGYTWSGTLPPERAGYRVSRGTVELAAAAAAQLEIVVAADAVVLMNTGDRPVSLLYSRAGNETSPERIHLAAGAYCHQR
ncbi:MAG: hypothetical protein J7639_04085 [Paenibacillaceae bacterium]|nr:hypothetical protein [Paenibacillaceae bacterium]